MSFLKFGDRQRLVVSFGLVIAALILSTAWSHNEIATAIHEGIDEAERNSREATAMYLQARAACCADRSAGDEDLEGKPLTLTPIWFMDPMDIIRGNIEPKYKQGKYLLFQDARGSVLVLDLDKPCEVTR